MDGAGEDMSQPYKVLFDLERSGEAYEFDALRVAQSLETGELFFAMDRGCSCPVPFDDISFPSDWTPIDPRNVDEFSKKLDNWANGGILTLEEKLEAVREVQAAARQVLRNHDRWRSAKKAAERQGK